jgi:hypothetical protein
MHIKNDPGGGGFSGPFADLLRVQTEFQARLGEETMRYLRRLQGALGPASPGTVLLADANAEVKAVGVPGGRAELRLELENLQRVHSVVTPQLTPLVGEGGAAWFPAPDLGAGFQIVPPGDVHALVLGLDIPLQLPPDTYRGALVLVGFSQGAVPVTVRVDAPPSEKEPAPRKSKSQTGVTPARRARRKS